MHLLKSSEYAAPIFSPLTLFPFYFMSLLSCKPRYNLLDGRYVKMSPNDRGHYAIAPMGVELGLIVENGVSWLRWWDESGNLLLTGDERAIAEKQARLEAEAIADQQKAIADQQKAIADKATLAQQQAEQKAQRLAERLRALGYDPEEI